MTQEELALTLLQNGNGYLTAKEAGEYGVSAVALKRLAESSSTHDDNSVRLE